MSKDAKNRVVVAMSGGVDSSVAAALLLEQGFDVIGVMLKLWKYRNQNSENNSIEDALAGAEDMAQKMGIPFEVIDAEESFRKEIVNEFVRQYTCGLTPNPCFICNQKIKWGVLLETAKNLGANALATGHYARIIKDNGNIYHLYKGIDDKKDQAYVLAGLTQQQLAFTMLPLGGVTKTEVKQLARNFGLKAADRPESQDLCFLPEGNYRDFLLKYGSIESKPGSIRLVSGEVIGEHQGLINYTIGQRKGLGSGLGVPYYVVGIDMTKNELIIGKKEDLGARIVKIGNFNWITGNAPDLSSTYQVKIRYRAVPVDCFIDLVDQDKIKVSLVQSVRDATPGQIAVIYNQEEVVGSGVILSTERE